MRSFFLTILQKLFTKTLVFDFFTKQWTLYICSNGFNDITKLNKEEIQKQIKFAKIISVNTEQ